MDVLMPQLGETVAEGKLTKWLKKVGDVVAAGELLFEIETDKTSMEVPTMVGGVIIEIRVQEGETVPVSSIVARIEGDNAGENAGRSQTAAVSPAVTPPLAVAVMPRTGATPVPFNAVVIDPAWFAPLAPLPLLKVVTMFVLAAPRPVGVKA